MLIMYRFIFIRCIKVPSSAGSGLPILPIQRRVRAHFSYIWSRIRSGGGFHSDRKGGFSNLSDKGNIRFGLVVILLLMVLAPMLWYVAVRLEGGRPELVLSEDVTALGISQELNLKISDAKSGLRKIRVVLERDGKEKPILEKDFPSMGFGRSGEIKSESIALLIEPKKMELPDGKVTLKIKVWDYAWRRWWHGNSQTIEKQLDIDTKPPGIEVLTQFHYVNQGGSGLVIYKTSEPCKKSGVLVGDHFFPAFPGHFTDNNILMGFFAVGYNQDPKTPVFLQSTDQAGNVSQSGFSIRIRKKIYRQDNIGLSDSFLNLKMPEFDIGEDEGKPMTPLEKFIRVNQNLRVSNTERVTHPGKHTENTLYWKNSFIRFEGSKMAGFADTRDYIYNGEKVDQQIHFGVDLASLKNSPVPAANAGKVIFADTEGIYGKTVIIDHGFGLLSMYSHLNRMDATVGDLVKRGDIIGVTGMTGMAGGDHLHFSILIHDAFVNPDEWWDPHWIKNNVTDKIDAVKASWP